VGYKDGIYTVTVGGYMEDWEKHELIKKFREGFQSAVLAIKQEDGPNFSGESQINTHF